MCFKEIKIELNHNMLWFLRKNGAKIERKNDDFCPFKMVGNIGISFKRALSARVYSKLEFYYTNHNYMYKKSYINDYIEYYKRPAYPLNYLSPIQYNI